MSASATRTAVSSAPQTEQPSVQDSSTESAAPVEAAAESQDSSTRPPLQWRDMVLNFSGTLGAAVNGTDEGQPFAIGQFGGLGDYFHTLLQGSALWRVGDWFRLGPEITFDHYRGSHRVYGSDLSSVSVGGVAELNLSQLWGDSQFTFFPRLRIDARLGVGFGTTTSEHALLEARLGPSLGIGAGLDVISARFGGIEASLGLYAGTQVVYDIGDSNHAFANVGGMITIRSSDLEETPVEIINRECSMSLEQNLLRDVGELQETNAELRENNAEMQEFLTDLQARMEERGITLEQLVQDMRTAYADWLQTRVENPVEDAEEAMALATERYGDDFNPFELNDIPATVIPHPLPEDCDSLYALQSDLQDERAALSVRKGFLEGSINAALIRLGVGPTAEQELVRVVTRLREIHFITNRPFGASRRERGYRREADIASVDAAVVSYLQGHQPNAQGIREPMPLNQMEDLYRSIFPRTQRRDGSGMYSPALDIIRQVSERLNSEGMNSTDIYVVGHTDSRGADDHNQGLSERRAQAIRDALVLFGVNPDRIHAIGRGETDPVYTFDQLRGDTSRRVGREEQRDLRESGIAGQALQDEMRGRQAVNRRIEMFLCFPEAEDETCTALGAEVSGQSTTTQAPAAGSDSTVQRAETRREVTPRRRRARTPEAVEQASPPAPAASPAVPTPPSPEGE